MATVKTKGAGFLTLQIQELATDKDKIDKCRVRYWQKPSQGTGETAAYVNFDRGHKHSEPKVDRAELQTPGYGYCEDFFNPVGVESKRQPDATLRGLSGETYYIIEVEVRSASSGLWSAPGGDGGANGHPRRICVKTARVDVNTRKMPNAEEVWDGFYPRVFSMLSDSDKINSAPCLIRDAGKKAEDRKPTLLERVPAQTLDMKHAKRWHQAHIIAHDYCEKDMDIMQNLIPTSGVENLAMRKRNLIDYVAEKCPQHLHEIAMRLKMAYESTFTFLEPTVDSFDFLWRLYALGEGWQLLDNKITWAPDDEKSNREGAICTRWRDLYRKFHCTGTQWAKYKLSDEEMKHYINHFSPSHNILYPEDFEIISGTDEPQTGEPTHGSHPVQLWFGGNSGKLIRLQPDHPYTIRHGPCPNIGNQVAMPGAAPPNVAPMFQGSNVIGHGIYVQGPGPSHPWGLPPGYGTR